MGFFDDADVDVNDVPDDPFGLGNNFWPTRIVELGDPKVTDKGDKYGMMVKWILDDPRFADSSPGKFGWSNWMQLPVPRVLQEQGIPWHPKTDEKHAQALFNLGELYKALGFPKDQWGKIGAEQLLGAGCLSKIKVQRGENGFWEFRFRQQKPFPKEGDGNGMGEFHPSTTSNPAQSKTAEELLEEEMKNA